MTAAKLIEYRIARQLVQRRSQQEEHGATGHFPFARQACVQSWADRLIAVLAMTIGLVVVGSYAEQLLWVLLAVATAFALRD